MPDFPAALDDALGAHYGARADFASPVESRRGFQARTRALERAYGSQKAAAEAAGVYPDTWRKWRRGVQRPSGASLAKVGRAHLALLRAIAVKRKGVPSSIEIRAIVACTTVVPGKKKKSLRYNGGRPDAPAAHRPFRADRLTGPQVGDVVGAWAAGRSPQTVADVLLDRIASAYGARFAFEGNNVTVTIHA